MSAVLSLKQNINLLIKSLQVTQRSKGKFSFERQSLRLSNDYYCEITAFVNQTKQKIFQIIQKQQILDLQEEVLNADAQKFFEQIRKSVSMLNKNINYLLEEGILNIYLSLSEIRERLGQNSRTLVLQRFVPQLILALSNFLRKIFVFQEYTKQLKKKQRLVHGYPLTYDGEFQKQNVESQRNRISSNKKFFDQIEESMSQQSLQFLLDKYLQDQIDQILQKEEKCKICSKNLKLESIEKHVKLCQKNSKLRQLMVEMKLQEQQLKNRATFQLERLKQSFNKSPQNQSLKKVITIYLRQKLAEKEKLTVRKRNESAQYINALGTQKTKWECHLFDHQLKYGQNRLLSAIARLQNEKESIQKQIGAVESLIESTQFKQSTLSKNKLSSFDSLILKSSKSMKITDGTNSSRKSISLNICLQEKLSKEDCIMEGQSLSDERSQCSSPRQYQNFNSFASKRKSFITKRNLQKPDYKMNEDVQAKNCVSLQHISMEQEVDRVSMQNFQILKVLGKGAFGKVYMVRRKQTRDLYALKIIKLPENCSDKDLQNIMTQNSIFKKIAGDHLVKAPFSFSEKDCHIFVMELMPGGDLRKLLTEEVYFEEEVAKFYLAEIVLAIEHLHSFDIIHRDLKPENLVLDHEGYLKLTDYGLSAIKIEKKLERQRQFCSTVKREAPKRKLTKLDSIPRKRQNTATLIGTPDYIAPQIINGISTQNKSVDWWSLGVMAYELLIGTRPFCADTIEKIIENIEQFNIEWPQVDTQDGVSSVAKDFIEQLLNKDFTKRLGANGVQQIKDHPFFKEIDWLNIKTQNPPFPPDMEKFSQEAAGPEDKQLRKEIENRLEYQGVNSTKPKKLKLQRFIRFDLLGTETMYTVEKIFTQSSDRLKKLRSCQTVDIEAIDTKMRHKIPSLHLAQHL